MDSTQTKTHYQIYLESDHWADLRDQCYRRDGFGCLSCRSSVNLSGHHLIYRNLVDCTPQDVMTLCWSCHSLIHQHMKINGIKSGVLGVMDVLSLLRKYLKKPLEPTKFIEDRTAPLAKDWNKTNIDRMRSHALKEYGGVFPPPGEGPFVITKAMMNLIRSDNWIFVGAVTDLLKVPQPLAKGWSSLIVGSMISKETLLECIKERNTTRDVQKRQKNPDFMKDRVL